MEKPHNEYCCTYGKMYAITDNNGDIIGYICSNCNTVYKYKLVKEDGGKDQ